VILVTGAAGSVGRCLVARLEALGLDVVPHDIATLDVTNEAQVADVLGMVRPAYIFHLAGAKHAPQGEVDPWHVVNVNTVGTRNVLAYAGGAKVIFASTCKACDPETAYGASKLIAERMVLNAHGTVIRLHNVEESDGNVFRLWESLPEAEPLPVTDCYRRFVSMDAVLELFVRAIALPSGRYAPSPSQSLSMTQKALSLYPERQLTVIERRRGDRFEEPLAASCEDVREVNGYLEITSPHDPRYEAQAAAAA
jgi:FlaA1/EpsC-like NDP-sugar epimerase